MPNGKAQHVKGFMYRFRGTARKNLEFMRRAAQSGLPVLFIEPSIMLTYREEYRKFLPGEDIPQVILLQEWLAGLDYKRTAAKVSDEKVYLMLHCTEKTSVLNAGSLWQTCFSKFGIQAEIVPSGCCGMAGVFGHETEHYEASKEIYELSWQKKVQQYGAQLLVSGYSCRSQVKRFSGFRPQHPAQYLLSKLYMNAENIFLGSEIEQSNPEASLFHILPIPYERTVSFGGGTALAPQVIIAASHQLEKTDALFGEPCVHGICTLPPVSQDGTPEEVMSRIALQTENISRSGKIPVGIGGEHTVTQGIVRGIKAAQGGQHFGPLFHACVMRRIHENGIPLHMVGIRAYCQEELDYMTENRIGCDFAKDVVPSGANRINLADNFPEHIYISIDTDGFDPSVTPATGTPVAGGLGWYQFWDMVARLTVSKKVIGFDLVEHAPIKGFTRTIILRRILFTK
ncbi:hypothetical protein CHS0354_018368 [Potamilus streckersoni]|uniref:Uncharacterized protein n=1 Tax=Potamilus streckersoni TaxID=2493646 RepID=A0AAE0TAH0_9BIVA|nr:hypothetical protein CHS0354_018368 [Potamilus streckersoni]